MHGDTISPVFYLVYLQITNAQDVPSTILHYSVSVSAKKTGPWENISPIPLMGRTLFFTRPPDNKQIGNATISFGRGAYRLATKTVKENLTHAVRVAPRPLLEEELRQAIPAHIPVIGWAAFDSKKHTGDIARNYFRITVKDSANITSTSISELPRKQEGDEGADPHVALMDVIGPITDISECYVRYFSDKYPKPTPR
jgi:hypothetical protein